MSYSVRVTPENRKRLYKKYGIESNGMLVIRSIEDLFCQKCGAILKPAWTIRRFRASRRKIEMKYFVARCARDGDVDCDHWVELLWKRTEEYRSVTIIESFPDIDILPTMKRNCRNCNQATIHVYYQVQTRSSDEPETTFYRCKICNRVERENI